VKSDDKWTERMMEGEARRRIVQDKMYSVNVSGTIVIDIDETVEVCASNKEEAERYARQAIDVTDIVEDTAQDLDFEVTEIEEK
jgi:hypothetical protein